MLCSKRRIFCVVAIVDFVVRSLVDSSPATVVAVFAMLFVEVLSWELLWYLNDSTESCPPS